MNFDKNPKSIFFFFGGGGGGGGGGGRGCGKREGGVIILNTKVPLIGYKCGMWYNQHFKIC